MLLVTTNIIIKIVSLSFINGILNTFRNILCIDALGKKIIKRLAVELDISPINSFNGVVHLKPADSQYFAIIESLEFL